MKRIVFVLLLILLWAFAGCAALLPQELKESRILATGEMKALVADVERGTDIHGVPMTLERILPNLKAHLKIDEDECAWFKGQKPEAVNP